MEQRVGPLGRQILKALKGKRLFKHEIGRAVKRRRSHVDDALEALHVAGLVYRNKSGTWSATEVRFDREKLKKLREAGANIFPVPTCPAKRCGGLWG